MEEYISRILNKVEQGDGCWLWKGCIAKNGYGQVRIKNKTYNAHRVSYCVHNKCSYDDIGGLDIRHSCHNRTCVNPSHLSTGTRKENMNDMVLAERQRKGMSVSTSKLSDEQVRSIYASALSHINLAKQYNVSISTIGDIKYKRTWKHLGL